MFRSFSLYSNFKVGISMKKKVTSVLSMIFIFFLSVIAIPQTHAEQTDDSAQSDVGYHIYAVLPENQIGKKDSFFNLRMVPGQKQTIEFVIANTSPKDLKFKIELNQAYTNKQGYIDYLEDNRTYNLKDKFKIGKIANCAKEVTLPKQSIKKIPIQISMPAEDFKGEILAGIKVTKVTEEQTGISNQYGYILGLRLTEHDYELRREIQLKKIIPAVSFGKTSVVVELLNPQMESYGKLDYKVEIKNYKSGKTVKTKSYKELQMAPNSLYKFAIDWDGEKLIPDEYRMKLTINDKKNNRWVFDKRFTITYKEANKVNEVVIDKIDPMNMKILIIILIVMVILLLVFWKIKKAHKSKS